MTPNPLSSTADDARLETAVRDAFDRYAPLRIWKHSLHVRANAGAVVLSGSVRSQTEKEVAEKLARAVKGVSSVQNDFVADSDFELTIAQALAADPRTRAGFPGILVGVVFGVVFLKGTVASDAIKKAAGEIAANIVGVQRVSNDLIMPAQAKVAA